MAGAGFCERHRHEAGVAVEAVGGGLEANQVEGGDVVGAGEGEVEAGADIGGSSGDGGTGGGVPVRVVEVGRRIDLGVLVVGGATAESTATDHNAAVVEQERREVVAAGLGHGGEGAPLVGVRVPNFRDEDAAVVGEFSARGIAADGEDFAIGEHDVVVEGAGIVHGGGSGDDGVAGADIDDDGGVSDGGGVAIVAAAGEEDESGAVLDAEAEFALTVAIGGAGASGGEGAIGGAPIEPTEGPGRAGLKDAAVGPDVEVREPLVIVVDIVVGVGIGGGIDTGGGGPEAGGGVKDFGYAVGVAAPPGEDASIGKGDAGVVPAALVHVAGLGPGGVGGGAGHDGGGANVGAATGGEEAAIGEAGDASAEHVVLEIGEVSEGVVAGVKDGGVGEGFAGGEGGGAGRGPGDDAAVREVSDGDGDVGPIDDGPPIAPEVALGGQGDGEEENGDEGENGAAHDFFDHGKWGSRGK